MYDNITAINGQAFLRKVIAEYPGTIRVILTDNGQEYTDRYANSKKGKPKNKPSGEHLFDL